MQYLDSFVWNSRHSSPSAMVGCFVEVCRRIGLKDNAGKGKAMVLNGEEGL